MTSIIEWADGHRQEVEVDGGPWITIQWIAAETQDAADGTFLQSCGILPAFAERTVLFDVGLDGIYRERVVIPVMGDGMSR